MSSVPGALIEYRDEGGFHDAFRTDLPGLKREGIILSPFLRSARAAPPCRRASPSRVEDDRR